MLARNASMDERMAMYNGNALKIGVFGANCSSGRSATCGSRLFISMRIAASCGQPLQEIVVPRGARTEWMTVLMM